MENIQQSTNRSWLQRLKEESWEAELLVSAVAIFAILKSFSLLDWLLIQFIDYLNPSQYEIGYFILVCGYLAIGILGAMFAIHFALRAYWIGLVGLNSVFPDYGLEDSAYSPIYTKKLLGILPKINASIAKIDELCSVIFSAAFALMMIYLYATILASIYLIIFNALKNLIPTWILLLPLGILALSLIFGLIISIPANMKKYHGNEKIQHLYFLYARWSTVPLYGPFYKSILQITMLFGSNFKKKKGLVKMVILMLIIGIIFGMTKLINSNFRYLLNHSAEIDITKVQSSYFANNNTSNQFLLTPEINSNLISESTIQLFIPIFEHEIKLLRTSCEIDVSDNIAGKEKDEIIKIRKAYLECYQNQHKVYIDDNVVPIEFLKVDHFRTEQYGLFGFIDIINLKRGQHQIRIQKNLTNENIKEWLIPFYYSPN